jgi:hypothetical protein
MTRWLALGALGVLALACQDGAPIAMDTEDGSSSQGTSGAPVDSTGAPDDTSAPDDTGPLPTTGSSNDSTTGPGPADSTDTGASTGGCVPGVFDDSRFDEACFQ